MSRLAVITDLDLGGDTVERSILEPLGFQVARYECRTEDDVIACAQGADALMVQWAPVTDRVLAQLPSCRVISRYGIGVDMIDIDAAARHGVAVHNVPDYCIEEVATHSVAMFLALNRQIVALDRQVVGGGWAPRQVAPPRRLSEMTVGVVGLGRIGARVAAALVGVGCGRVIGFDPVSVPAGVESVRLDRLLRDSDAVLLHCPLIPSTRHMIGPDTLARMRPGALIVNVSRGGLIDEDALAQALQSGRIGGAALDVFSAEPLPANAALRAAPNVIATPHAAWYSGHALPELQLLAARNVARHFYPEDSP